MSIWIWIPWCDWFTAATSRDESKKGTNTSPMLGSMAMMHFKLTAQQWNITGFFP